MYNISDIVHTHRLLLTCNYELCILYSIAHYSHTYTLYMYFFKVGFKIFFPMHNVYRKNFAYWTITNFCNFFYESVIEARGQEWRPQ